MKILSSIPAMLLAVVCCWLHHEAKAQYKFEKAIYISKEQGLPGSHVYLAQKGPDGFVWVGTHEGLGRFDGQQFKVYRQGNDPRYSLYDNTINTILPLEREIWVGTNMGISVLDIGSGQFRHYQLGETRKNDTLAKDLNFAVHILKQDASGLIWAGTRTYGVWSYDPKKDVFKKYEEAPGSYPPVVPLLGSHTSVLSVEFCKTNDSIVWAGTVAGLQEINKYTGKVTWHVFPQKDKDYQVSVNAFRRIYHHTDGLLYVGGWSAGMHIYDPATKTMSKLPVGKRWERLMHTPIASIYRKSDHELWITALDGLAVYDTKLKDVTWARENYIPDNLFYGVNCIDEHNRIWYGNINGLQCYDPAMQQFTTHSFASLYGREWGFNRFIVSDPTGNKIIVCPIQANGMYVFDRQNNTWTKQTFEGPAPYKKLEVRGLAALPDGKLAISATEGLFTYQPATRQLTAMKPPPTQFHRYSEMLLDKRGRLWLAADLDGLICWDYRTGQSRNYTKQIWAYDTSVPSVRVANMFIDSHDNVWFARYNGLGVYIAARDTIVNFIYSLNKAASLSYVNTFAEDKTGRIWISNNEGWVGFALLASPEKGIVSKIWLPDKKIEENITSLATDREGNVWGHTHKRLVRFGADDISISTFNFQYGLREPDFYHFSFLPTGEMVFGGRNDIVLANPATFKRNEELPVPYINELHVLNQPIPFPVLFEDTTLELAHDRNFFTIGFSAQAYTLSNEVRFRYRLQNFDDWKEVSGRNTANYTNVPPGEYVFQLQAANNEGVWNTKTLQLSVHVATPWWQTWWFRIAALLLTTAVVYWLYRYRIRQVRKKEQMKSQYERKLANVEMSALLAQMNPHFLFNSLNSIDSYIIRNESKKASEYLNSFARLMRLILQNSRSNYVTLKDEIETLDLYLQMEGLRFRDQFQYEIKVDTTMDASAIVIPPMLMQPYIENAIWHGLMHKNDGTARKVELLIEERNNYLFCVIQDNGVGRAKAQALRSHKQAGKRKSMGMQITQDRIDIINKLYDINTCVTIKDLVDDSGSATGTRVELVIPL
jgi:ligand-binding sensor domain-containing protein/two-component sensor histidine kinase